MKAGRLFTVGAALVAALAPVSSRAEESPASRLLQGQESGEPRRGDSVAGAYRASATAGGLLAMQSGESPASRLLQGQESVQLGAREIMEKNFFATKVSVLKAESAMILINDRGQKRERKNMTLIKLQPDGVDSKFLVRFSTPADIRGTGFLQIEHSEGDDDQWIYLPALKKSRRLVANNKKDSFVGSDFSYGDISLPKVDLWKHTLLRSEPVGAEDCYVVESTPADETIKSNSGYSRKVCWVSKHDFVERKVDYYDLGGRLLKTQLVDHVELVEPDKGRWFPRHREMLNHQTGHRTVFDLDRVDLHPAASDDVFTTRSIERE